MRINRNLIRSNSLHKPKPIAILDWDDVLCPLIEWIVADVNKRKLFAPELSIEEFNSWDSKTERTNIKYKYFEDARTYESQRPYPGAQEFVRELSKYCEIVLFTAINAKFVGIRFTQCLRFFPEIKPENIITGSNKSLIKATFSLDDGSHNYFAYDIPYKVLRRQPWNQNMTGMLAANNFDEFLQLVKEVIGFSEDININEDGPLVLVGPSGSNKYDLASLLEKSGKFERPITWSDGDNNDRYHNIPKAEFCKMKVNGEFIETTKYANISFGTIRADIDAIISNGKIPIMVLDICGAMAMRKEYPGTITAYVKRHTRDILTTLIMEDSNIEDKVNRIISLDVEEKNESLCDFVINMDAGVNNAANQVMNLLS